MLLRLHIFFLFFSCQIFSQDFATIDSLELLLKKTNTDSSKADLLNTLALELRNSEKEKALRLANEALILANTIKYHEARASSHIVLGLVKRKQGEMEVAEINLKKAIEIREKYASKSDLAKAYYNLGFLYIQKSELELAETTLIKALNLLENENSHTVQVSILSSISRIYSKRGNYNKALEILNECLPLHQIIKNPIEEANTFLQVGKVYLQLDNWEMVEKSYSKSIDLFQSKNDQNGIGKCFINFGAYHFAYGENQEAEFYFKEALLLKDHLSISDLGIVYNNLGNLYKELGRKNDLEKIYLESLNMFKKIGNKSKIAKVNYNLGMICFHRKEYEKSLNYFRRADLSSLSKDDPYFKSQLFFHISETYSHLEKDELAFEFLQKYNSIRDTLNQNYIRAINSDRNLEEQKKENVQLKLKDTQTQKENQLLLSFGIGFLLMLIIFIMLFIGNKNKQKRLLAELKNNETKEKIDTLLKEQELKTAYAKLAGKDEEQQRIAKDLHDRLGVMLSTIKLYFNDVDQQLKEIKNENNKQHQKANELLDEACEEVRRIAHNMETGLLAKYGLIDELKGLIGTLNDSNQIQAKLYVHGIKERMDIELEGKIYKIIQELVGNALKHSNAQNLTIQLNKIKEDLNILVEDNGVGFNAEKAIEKNGMGLRNVNLRVTDLNGKVHIDSGKGHGTTISIDIPISLN